ncbi:hypothetical protein [Motiliproteus sp. MSK22-1]|uniref:hypothetical protein n=1 Tax=Motiliproteus sp. MSK22-1 TaxID=1897630 RepID=UPI000975C786|nr:hypothetical protein [Motiliproteus sp. MSK22-1]OMH36205.1 hypothetical protein BGP75_10215 [Motiliproteus sp. MSK22-1]
MHNFRCAVSLVINVVIATSLITVSLHSRSDPVLTIKHYQDHSRYKFGLAVLGLVLNRSGVAYQLTAPDSGINEGRGERLVILGNLDLEFMSTTPEREKYMIAVKIPIYSGLLGARLLLVNKSDKKAFSHVRNIEELRSFVGGHGLHWGDLPVYAANHLPVQTSATYDTLFKMLKGRRFNYFHRGISEIWGELSQHEADLTIADNVFLFYPHPVYFFVTKSKPELAKQIEKGFKIALTDGSYKQLFDSEYKDLIQKAQLGSRKLIVLKNPVNPPCTPPIDTHWWAPEKFKVQLSQTSRDTNCSRPDTETNTSSDQQ